MPSCISPQEFAQYLVEQAPIFDEEIIRDIRPIDGLIGHMSVGEWDPYDGVSHTKDRFRNVQPDVTKRWQEVENGSCLDAPCDPDENFIGFGYDRITYGQERQSWRSQLFCFDQMLTVNKAEEHISQIISDVLRPATSRISSFYLRKQMAAHAGKKWLAGATMADFTYSWDVTGDADIYIDTSGEPTSILTPQMLQRRLARLRNVGYFGKWTNDPFWGGYDRMVELLTDDDTAWSLDKAASDGRVSDAWRFQTWNAAHEYYKYGMGGQIGDFMVHVDPFPMRFNKVSTNRFQIVLPYKNVAATVGIGSDDNPDFHNAQYQFSLIWHRMALKLRVQRMRIPNPNMPFAVRDLGGAWNFAMNDLGRDCDNRPIANYRKNKGFFYADFQYGTEPLHVEWAELIFHKREPMRVTAIDVCGDDPGYPTQNYNSANAECDTTQVFSPIADDAGNYHIEANTITCDGIPVAHAAVSSATIAALVTALNADAGTDAMGLWVQEGVQILLTETNCESVAIPWVV